MTPSDALFLPQQHGLSAERAPKSPKLFLLGEGVRLVAGHPVAPALFRLRDAGKNFKVAFDDDLPFTCNSLEAAVNIVLDYFGMKR